jgi:glutamine synthetase
VAEAGRRGLPNLRRTPEALAQLVTPDSVAFLQRMRVFSEAETEARYHVRVERYVKDIEIEVEALKALVSTHVLPAAYKQHALLASAGARHAISMALDRLGSHMDELVARMAELQGVAEKAGAEGQLGRKAAILAEEVVPSMGAVREVCDRIEESVADEFWTLPKYREMLLLI